MATVPRAVLCALVAVVSTTAASWVEVGERNYAVMEKYIEAMKIMDNEMITPELLVSASKKMESFFAPKVACKWARGSRYQVDLEDVAVDECFAKIGNNVFFLKQKVGVTSIAIDPKSGGKTILVAWGNDEVWGTTPSGEMIPGTWTRSPDDSSVFEFNDEGRIVLFTGNVDSGILNRIQETVDADTHTELSEKTPQQSYGTTIGTVAVVFLAGLIVGCWDMRRIKFKTVQQPLLLA